MATQMIRRPRQASPERWRKAAERAISEGIEVRQVNSTGMWVANSGSAANVAYVLEIVGGLVRSCSCPAGEFGDACCKHAARYYLDTGVLDPAPVCIRCQGHPWRTLRVSQCPACHSAGRGEGAPAIAA